jgi:hypothetical protein
MNTATFFRGVEELLFLAFAASIADAVDEFTGESIYALILYPSGGFTSFGIAVSSRERIAASPRSSDVDVELLGGTDRGQAALRRTQIP